MPYKKESPFANFRDPKRTTKNYNPTNFQMPDISSIYSKTADGEKVDEVDDTKSTGNSDTDLINKGEKAKKEATEGPVTRKSLRQNRRAGEKEFNKELRRNRRLSKASTKDITAKEREFYEDATDKIQGEKDFRKEAKKEGFNPADYKTKLMMDEQAAKVKKMDKDGDQGSNALKPKSIVSAPEGKNSPEWQKLASANADIMIMNNSMSSGKKEEAIFNPLGRGNKKSNVKYNDPKPDLNERMKEKARDLDNKDYPGDFSFAQEVSERENKPMEKIRVADGAASWRDFQAPFNDPTENEYLTPTQKKKLQMIKNPLGRGPQMNKNMKQVNSKGSGFPMVSPLNAVTAGSEMQQQNQRISGEQPMQPMQNQQQGGLYGDPANTVTPNRAGKGQNSNILTSDPNINQPANKVPASTEAQNKFFSTKASSSPASSPMPPNMVPAPSVGSGVGAGVSSGVGSPAGTFTSTGQGGSGATGINRENLFLNSAAAMYSDGPSKALVGNQDRLPEHLKAKIEAAPGMYGDDRKKPTANEMKKDGTRVNIPGTNSPDFGKSNETIKSNSPSKPKKMFGSEILYKQDKSYNDAYKSYEDSTKAYNKDLDRFMEGDTSAGKYPMPKAPKYKDHFEKLPGMYSPFEFTPGGRRTEVGKRSEGGKTTTVYRRDGSKKSEFTEKDSGTKKETRYTASPRSLKGKAVKVDVKDNATRTYTKYKRDGSVKKTMTANKKGGVDIDKSKKLRAKNRRSKKGTTRY